MNMDKTMPFTKADLVTTLKVVGGLSIVTAGLGWLAMNIPSGALYHNSKRKDAEDYNSFTQDMEDLIDKYGKLEHYETQYYDNRMDVSFAFRPHDPYFDDVELDSENWGGDPDGPLAQALAAVREKSKRYAPKPLRLTKLPHPDQKTLKDFEADEWKLLPRDALGRWQKPVDSESIYQLRETLSSDVPDISELLTMYGGDTPSNRFRLYRDLQQLSLDQMDAALPDDSEVSFDEGDMTWMTPEEYFHYILEEEINVPEGEDEGTSLEGMDRLVRYTASVMSPSEVEKVIADNMADITADLFVNHEDAEEEIAFMTAVLRYQNFASRWEAEANQFKCDLCGTTYTGANRHVAGVGHYIDNYDSKGGYCCDQCNYTVILPARMRGEHL
jgi:hypothetical protein